MYTKKNSIILSILLIVVFAMGTSLVYKGKRRIEKLGRQNEALTEKLNGSMEIVKTYHELHDAYDALMQQWTNSPKRILAADEPALTISYIHWLTTENKFGMEFDFALKSVEPQEDISSFSFSLAGEGSYEAIYNFIKYLTEHPILYKIENIELSRQEEEPNVLNFSIDIRGYFLNQKWKLKEDFDFTQVKLQRDREKFYDIFKPLVVKPVSRTPARASGSAKANGPQVLRNKPKDSDLIKYKLLAITRDSVYLLSTGKKIVKMKLGETAYGGTLTRIDQQKSIAQFRVIQDGQQKQISHGLD